MCLSRQGKGRLHMYIHTHTHGVQTVPPLSRSCAVQSRERETESCGASLAIWLSCAGCPLCETHRESEKERKKERRKKKRERERERKRHVPEKVTLRCCAWRGLSGF